MWKCCSVFCCPPYPSKIAVKMAYNPPARTYSFNEDSSVEFKEKAGWMFPDSHITRCTGFCVFSEVDNINIACMYVRCSTPGRFTILFSHANGVDLGIMSSILLYIGEFLNCNVLSYDYCGYGLSTGKKSERNIYAAIDLAWEQLHTKYNIESENVILYGHSIGSVPTIDLASRIKVAGVVIHSGLTSAVRIIFPKTKKTKFFDAFPNIDKISSIESPILIIHGTDDEIIPFSHGVTLYNKCTNPVSPLWVENAGHSDVHLYPPYFKRLKDFVTNEILPTNPKK